MANDVVKTFFTKDRKFKVEIIREEYAENPRNTTDEPLHCIDFSREYSIMTKEERENRYNSVRDALESFLCYYGDYRKVIDRLVENGKHLTDGKATFGNALVYSSSDHAWILKEYTKYCTEKEYSWKEIDTWACKKYEIDLYNILPYVFDNTIDKLLDCLTDDIKIGSYDFGYYGSISFSDSFDTDATGLCWLEKKEFLKYSGCNEDQWTGKKLSEIEFLIKEITAWADDDVFGFKVSERKEYTITKTLKGGEEEPESYDQTVWEEIDSCWGFYGELDEKQIDWILSGAGYKREDMTEVDE